MFVGWVYNRWETRSGKLIPIAQERADFIDKYMGEWITAVIEARQNR